MAVEADTAFSEAFDGVVVDADTKYRVEKKIVFNNITNNNTPNTPQSTNSNNSQYLPNNYGTKIMRR